MWIVVSRCAGKVSERSGVYVEASSDVTVQAASVSDMSTEAYLVLPTAVLGTDHYVVAFVYSGTSPAGYQQGPSQLGVVAASDGTRVLVTLPNAGIRILGPGTGVSRSGNVLSVTLNMCQTFQVSRRIN